MAPTTPVDDASKTPDACRRVNAPLCVKIPPRPSLGGPSPLLSASIIHQNLRGEMAIPPPDPEQTERLLFMSNQSDNKFSNTLSELTRSLRQQCQTTEALHLLGDTGSFTRPDPSRQEQLVTASREANEDVENRMRALNKCFEEQRDVKARALSALATDNSFFVQNNALLLKECQDVIAQDNELQEMYIANQRQCEDLKKQVAALESERVDLSGRATTAERQQNLLQVHIDHRTRQYNKCQAVIGSLEGQVRQLEGLRVDDRKKLEEEKRQTTDRQASKEQLETKVKDLEHSLSQSNDSLELAIRRVATQQATNNDLMKHAHELEVSLESSRKELSEETRVRLDLQNVTRGLESKVKQLEQSLQSTKDRLEIEKSLSNTGQNSVAKLTVSTQQLERSLDDARQEVVDEKLRHAAQERILEQSLHQSTDSLEACINRCNNKQASIGSLERKVQQLEGSLEKTHKALEDEKCQSAIQQASAEELRTTTTQLERSLQLASDYLEDTKSRCNIHQASVVSWQAKAHKLEQALKAAREECKDDEERSTSHQSQLFRLQTTVRKLKTSLHLAREDLKETKQREHASIANLDTKVHELEQMLDLARKDLEGKTIRCVTQDASILDMNNSSQDLEKALQSTRDDLEESKQRCSTQQLSMAASKKRMQELEKSLHSNRCDLKAKVQTCSNQQQDIDNLRETERRLRRSLELSQREARAERDRRTTQQAFIAGLEKDSRELGEELRSTRDQLKHAEQLCNTRHNDDACDVEMDLEMDVCQLEDDVESDAIKNDLAQKSLRLGSNSTTQPVVTPPFAQAAPVQGEGSHIKSVAHLQQELTNMTTSLQTHQNVIKKMIQYSLEEEIPCTTLAQDLSEIRKVSEKEVEAARTSSAFVRVVGHTNYSLKVVKAILRHLSPNKHCDSNSESEGEMTVTTIEVASNQFLPQPSTKNKQDRVSDQFPMLYEEPRGDLGNEDSDSGYSGNEDSDCESEYAIKYGDKKWLNAMQTTQIRKAVSIAARNLYSEYWVRSTKWLDSTTRATYHGASDEKTLAALSLIDQIVVSEMRPDGIRRRVFRKSCPPNPNCGLEVLRERLALYWSMWYRQAAGMDHEPIPDEPTPKANTARKRHKTNQLETEARRTKRRSGFAAADPVDIDTASDLIRRRSKSTSVSSTEQPQRDHNWLTPGDQIEENLRTLDIHALNKLASLRRIQRSAWSNDTSEDARSFVNSLTQELAVNVLSRLAVLSETHPVQQVVLQINLKQLHDMLEYLNGDYIIPFEKSGVILSETHVPNFQRLQFNQARLDNLLDYQLDSARFNHYNKRTLVFRPSGLLTVAFSQESPSTARTLRERFDAETIAAMQVTKVGQREVSSEVTHSSGDTGERSRSRDQLEHALGHHVQEDHAAEDFDDQGDISTTSQTCQSQAMQADSPRGQHQTDMEPILPGGRGRRTYELAKANDPMDVHNDLPNVRHRRKAAATRTAKQITRSKSTQNASRHTSVAPSRPRRQLRPSRRAAEASSAS